ncbi:hypothetical protein [Deinococcus sp. RM]|uniref:hypothetical protein n=1 Tax=Deinococcus sp. RM TaxID=2316359 RepID=UPI0011C221EE|nr:hypothetical protein [Deinococcus sp. RM]
MTPLRPDTTRPQVLIRDDVPFAATQWSYESPHSSEDLTCALAAALSAHPDGVTVDFTGTVIGDLALRTAFAALADGQHLHAGDVHRLTITGLDGREDCAWTALRDALAQGFSDDDHAELDRERMGSQGPVERALRSGTHVCGVVIQAHGPGLASGQVRLIHAGEQVVLTAADVTALGEALCGGPPVHRQGVQAHPGVLTLSAFSPHFTLDHGLTWAERTAPLHWTPPECFLVREVLLMAGQFSERADTLGPLG